MHLDYRKDVSPAPPSKLKMNEPKPGKLENPRQTPQSLNPPRFQPDRWQWKWIPIKVSLAYATFAALWILLSDEILGLLVHEPDILIRIGTYKGMLFVVITSLSLAWLLERYVEQIRKSREASLESEERFRLLVSGVKDYAIFMLDPDGVIVSWNEGAERIKGYTADEIVGSHFSRFYCDEDVKAGLPEAALKSAAREGRHEEEGWRLRRDGSRFWADIHTTALRDSAGNLRGFSKVIRDITEWREAKLSIEKLQRRNELILNSAGDGICGIDEKGICVFANPAAAEMLGFTIERLIGQPIHPLIHHSKPDGTPYPIDECPVTKSMADGLQRTVSEEVFWRKDGTCFPVEYTCRPINEDNRVASMVVTFRDITGRQRAEETLRESERRFRSMVETTSDWVWAVDMNGIYVYASPRVKNLLGYEPEEVLGKSPIDFMPPDEAKRIGLFFSEIAKAQQPFERLENLNLHKDGSLVLLETSGVPVFDSKGIFRGFQGIDRDITERKRVEEELLTSERKYRELVENANSIILRWNREGHVTFLNEFGQTFFGYSEQEILGHHVMGTIVPEEETTGRNLRPLMDDICAHPEKYEQNTNENMLRNGQRVWIAWTNKIVFDDAGQVKEVLSIGSDITKRREAEQAVLRRNRQLQVLARTAEQINSVLETPVVMRTLVASAMELTGATDGAAGLVVNDQMVFTEYNRKGKLLPIDFKFDPGYGVPGWVMQTHTPYVSHDAEHDPHVVPEIQKQLAFCNLADVPILGREGKLLGCFEIHNKTEGPFDEADVELLKGLAANAAIALENTQLLMERQRAEETLRKSEERMRLFYDLPLIGMAIVSPNQKWLQFNDKLCEILGYSREEMKGLTFLDLTHPDDMERSMTHFNRVLAGEIDGYSLDKKYVRKDGRQVDVSVAVRCVRHANGLVDYFVSLVQDITERKRMEGALRESEYRYRHLFSHAPISIWEEDFSAVGDWMDELRAKGISDLAEHLDTHPGSLHEALSLIRVLDVNETTLKAFEASCKEDLFDSLNRVFTEETYQGFRSELLAIWEGKNQMDFEFTAQTLKGRRLDCLMHWIAPVESGHKVLSRVIVAIADITERKLAEKELKRSEAELRALSTHLQTVREDESTRIARELHDELGQTLTGIKMDLSWLMQRLENQPALLDRARETLQLADSTVQVVRRICTELRPGVLDDLGLVAALEWQASDFERRTGIQCVFTSSDEELALPAESATALFRICQEALTNVARHAAASHVSISLVKDQTTLSMKITDNGKGIGKIDMDKADSFGVVGMRERAALLGWSFSIENVPNGGTCVSITSSLSPGSDGIDI